MTATLTDLITDALSTLHWLRVPERVQHKIAVLTFCTAARHDIWDLWSPSLTYQVGVLCGQQVPAAWPYRPSNCLLLAAVPFRLMQLKFGTACQRPSSHRHHCRVSGVN